MSASSVAASSITQGLPKSRSLLAGNYAYGGGATWLIERINVGSAGASSVTFSNIPKTFKHLQIRGLARMTAANYVDDTNWTFNNDNGTNYYATHQVRGNGSAVSAYASGTATYFRPFPPPEANTGSNIFGVGIIDIHNYTSTNMYKTIRSLSGYDDNTTLGYASVWFRSCLWMSTAAVNTISIAANSGVFSQYSSFALYGVVG